MRSLSIVPLKDPLQWDCEHKHEVERMNHLVHSMRNINRKQTTECQHCGFNIKWERKWNPKNKKKKMTNGCVKKPVLKLEWPYLP